MIDEENVWRCPRRPLKDDPAGWGRLLFFYGFYKKGQLPDVGGVVDQSAKAMKLFTIIDDLAEECAKKKAEDEADRGRR